ncbi:resolvase [Spirosoma sp. KCTC 42546]|uniref:recombinase family protein n=1 Tax=Spirosoma sp. KCTC 42546 TaxID=2520506 RepID=UPI00115B690D|nr:recombinase family protein [Spirosoma sp. KCTC 42546]QDK83897.1 resolvase [Spirosoma sp. KCTC 42546]
MPTTYSYLRVSTEEQDLDKDRLLVLEYANKLGIGPVEFQQEKISGKVNWRSRKVAQILDLLQEGDILIEPEMYRLGRSTSEIHQMADVIRHKKAVLHLIRENIVLDGSPVSDLIFSVLAATGQFELRLTSERTKAGQRKAVASGKRIGRPEGPGKSKLDEKAVEIRALLANGSTKKFIARRYGCSESTLHEWIKKKLDIL